LKLEDPILSVFAPSSEVRTFAMSILLADRNILIADYKAQIWGGLQWYEIRSKI